jgi:very-short-patch-repair endonuclease
VDVADQLQRLGGVSTRRALVRVASRAGVDSALRNGAIVRDGRGRYALPVANTALRRANALAGVVSYRSAALLHGWQLKIVPEYPDVTVPPNRKVSADRRLGVTLHRGRPAAEGLVTTEQQTLVDCMRTLPFDEALTVADSALRHGSITKRALTSLAASVEGPGAAQCRLVARAATGAAANPFESVLRAITLDVPSLSFTPQQVIREGGLVVRPDLVDAALHIVVEADSFEWHGDRASLHRDCRRYNALAIRGWIVLRFSWEDVMLQPQYVRQTLQEVAGVVHRRRKPRFSRPKAA